jgi:GT2 family glycosyltransferase
MIDICITTYNGHKGVLKKCLGSLIEKTKFVDFRIWLYASEPDREMEQIIWDSMHVDNILFTDRIEILYNDNNCDTYSRNNNSIAEEGDGDLILFLNDDTEVINDDWLYQMQKIMLSDEKVGAVGALLLYPDMKTVQHCGVMFSTRTNNLPFHMYYRQPLKSIQAYASLPRYYQAVTAACMLVRRADFMALGGFYEEFKNGFEDIALCIDIKEKLGKRMVYCPNAQLIHHEGVSGKFKEHPDIQNNIKVLREKYAGKFFNDENFYLSSINHMVYKYKPMLIEEDE